MKDLLEICRVILKPPDIFAPGPGYAPAMLCEIVGLFLLSVILISLLVLED